MLKHLYPFERFPRNPILTKDDIPYPCNTVFNAAATKFQDKYFLILRVEDLKGHSHLTLANSTDGYHFEVHSNPWGLGDFLEEHVSVSPVFRSAGFPRHHEDGFRNPLHDFREDVDDEFEIFGGAEVSNDKYDLFVIGKSQKAFRVGDGDYLPGAMRNGDDLFCVTAV